MIHRYIEDSIKNQIFKGKAIILLGSRQTGKTTLLESLFSKNDDVLWLNGDELDVQALFSNTTCTRIQQMLGNRTILVIDEAQRITDIGLRMKLVTDQLKHVQLIATGSSAFELANRLNEPLTGRKWEYQLFPLSFGEMVKHQGLLEETRMLPVRLVYGYYPEVVTSIGDEKEVLKLLTNSYLYKDVLTLGQIKKSDKLVILLQALAYQVGSQVSYSELARTVGIDVKTVEAYLDVLEQSYIIFRLSSYSRNMRNELKNSKKIYFYDNGVRNALISNFSDASIRSDMGALWENFVISERIKYNAYTKHFCNTYFWRSKNQNEIDYIEEFNGQLHAYEFKYNPRKRASMPIAFSNNYPTATFTEITPDNLADFVL